MTLDGATGQLQVIDADGGAGGSHVLAGVVVGRAREAERRD